MHECKKHNIRWVTTPSRALSGVGCKLCQKEKSKVKRFKYTDESFRNEISKKYPHITAIGKYYGMSKETLFYCSKHDVQWLSTPDNILRGHGCKMCGFEKMSVKNKRQHEEYLDKLKEKSAPVDIIEEYKGANVKVLHRCKKCGYEWKATPGNILYGNMCPKCKTSRGEREISAWLDSHSIEYTVQKKFSNCADKKPLPFDFYLPSYNALIEYDGEQHYRPVEYFGGIKTYEKLKYHDMIKDQFCAENNLHLLRISYNEDIAEKLNNFVFS